MTKFEELERKMEDFKLLNDLIDEYAECLLKSLDNEEDERN